MSKLSFEGLRSYLGCGPEGRKKRRGTGSHFRKRDPSTVYVRTAALIKNDKIS